ncbi:MAG TPA: helix-turn-helix transcriptional regulator [Jatrophihabitans sp.]|nr:helix-turn-helix transcriptional regulator [Jatrophihabitans sp.]
MQAALAYFAQRTHRSVINTNPGIPLDLDGYADDLDRAAAERGVTCELLVGRDAFEASPGRILLPPSTLLGPTAAHTILADDETLIFTGAPTPSGRTTGWASRNPALVEEARRVLSHLQEAARPAGRRDYAGDRAVRVLRMLGRGHTDRQIAGRLGVSLRTVSGDVARLQHRVEADSRAALFAKLASRVV